MHYLEWKDAYIVVYRMSCYHHIFNLCANDAGHFVYRNSNMYFTSYDANKVIYFDFFLFQLYDVDKNPERKEFLDNLFSFMQQRGKNL